MEDNQQLFRDCIGETIDYLQSARDFLVWQFNAIQRSKHAPIIVTDPAQLDAESERIQAVNNLLTATQFQLQNHLQDTFK